MAETIIWPRKTRELHNHHFDSTIWNYLQFRDDDIIIATYAKSLTTWMQQIIAQMLYGPDPGLEVAEMSPWLDLRVPPQVVKLPVVEAQSRRRFLETHLPVDALVFSPRGNVPLPRARRPRRRVESVQSPYEREPEMVCGAQ
jgi:aryl sulfotransferase